MQIKQEVTPRRGVWIEIDETIAACVAVLVTPRRGVWIEIPGRSCGASPRRVTPRRGVWIEMARSCISTVRS